MFLGPPSLPGVLPRFAGVPGRMNTENGEAGVNVRATEHAGEVLTNDGHHCYDEASMTITIDPKLEARLRARAEAEGLTVAAYVERLVSAEQSAEEELERLALEGLSSGEPIQVDPAYWAEKHRRLEQRMKDSGTR